MDRDCNQCVYSTREGGCRKYKCEGTKTVEDIRSEVIEECFKKIEQRLNDDTEVSFDLPVEEVLGENIDMDDFLMLAERIVQEYKRLIFSKLREAKYQLKEQK